MFPYLDPGTAFRAAIDPTTENLQALLQADERGPTGMRYWVATDPDSGKVIGTTGLYFYPDDPDAVWMGWFGVAPEARGQGVGKKLLEFTLAEAEKTGRKYFRLYTSDHPNEAVAQGLYEKHGFAVTGTEPIDGTPWNLIFRERRLTR